MSFRATIPMGTFIVPSAVITTLTFMTIIIIRLKVPHHANRRVARARAWTSRFSPGHEAWDGSANR